MKKNYLFFTLCLLASVLVSAAPRYWVGPWNGNWNNGDYWSATNGGSGGAGVPGAEDSVVFSVDALVNVDVSPVITSLRIITGRKVTLYTAIPTVFTVTNTLNIESSFPNRTMLTDSTSADVPFNFLLSGTARGTIAGEWVFEGGIPVSFGNGPTFSGGSVFVSSGLIFKANSADIPSSTGLSFGEGAFYQLQDKPGGSIPRAIWAGEIRSRYINRTASRIIITGNTHGTLRHLHPKPVYGHLEVNLPSLTADVSLALQHGTQFNGNVSIRNTNNHTLTLLAANGPSDSVLVTVGQPYNFQRESSGGRLIISGTTTKVTLATATSAAPATWYRLQLSESYNQSGGNFSLQDYDNATGSSILAIKGGFNEGGGGSFITNSTATGPDTKFIVEMDAPLPVPDDFGRIFTLTAISVGSGTIDNGRNMVTLRINNGYVFQPTGQLIPYGVNLSTPLKVGRLDLLRGTLNTNSFNIITITDPDVQTGLTGLGYVNGPVRRSTNSTNAYVFPTGRGNTPPAPTVSEPCELIPASAEPSLYQAEYFNTSYADTQHVQPPLTGVSKAEYWNISKISGADAKVQLTVRESRLPITGRGATNRDVLVVARYADGQWVSEQGSVLSPGDTIAGSVVSKTLSAFGPFTFGYYPADGIQPVFVRCPSNITGNTDQNSCNALVEFKAESGANSTIVYGIGSATITSPYYFPKGTTTVNVTASDNISTASCSFTVTVNDAQAPVITGVSANPAILSPANNEFRNVFIDYIVTDNCGPVTTSLSVSSNGSQNDNWEIVDEHNVRLLAEKSDEDLIYTITITGTDGSGNQSVKTVTVTVPKETGKDKDKKIKLKVKVTPNPSRTCFNLYVTSNSDKLITMQVFDQSGRIKEVRRFYPDATIRLGDNYRPGIYYVKFSQGNADKNVTLIKLPN